MRPFLQSRALAVLLFALAALFAVGRAAAQEFATVPALTSPVMDTIGLLAPQQRAALTGVLQDYERRTGSQIVVLIVDSTAPEAIEQYGIRVADTWKIGRKGIDDGVILIVAKNNPRALRRLRIEAGRGVQGSLTDAQSKRILEDVIAPHFRQDDFYGGLSAGVAAITALLDREHFAPPEDRQSGRASTADGGALWPFLLFLLVIVLPMFARRRHYRGLDGNAWGRSAGVILGSGIGSSIGGWGRGGYGNGADGGGFSGGGFSGGGFSGGGFSGGGGTFDGGGASGDW